MQGQYQTAAGLAALQSLHEGAVGASARPGQSCGDAGRRITDGAPFSESKIRSAGTLVSVMRGTLSERLCWLPQHEKQFALSPLPRRILGRSSCQPPGCLSRATACKTLPQCIVKTETYNDSQKTKESNCSSDNNNNHHHNYQVPSTNYQLPPAPPPPPSTTSTSTPTTAAAAAAATTTTT